MEVTQRTRPVGITVISIILWVVGVLSLIFTILGFVGVGLLSHNGAVTAVLTIALIVAAIIAIAEIVCGWGLWTLKRWAFWAVVIVEAFRVLDALYSWLGAHNSFASVAFGLIVGIIILVYLFADRNVRAAFRV